jgi:uncharacterized protein (DUF305 family)
MRTRTLTVAGLLAGTVVLAACGGTPTNSTTASGGASGGASASAQKDVNQADVTFATDMRPHHAQAVEMANMVLDRNPPAAVAALAQKIKAAQTPEIAQLDAMLDHVGTAGSTMTGHSGMSMPTSSSSAGTSGSMTGMMTSTQMDELGQAQGVQAGKVFLTLMTEHHRSAIEMARTELRDGRYAPARTLAGAISQSQTAEVAQMQQLLSQL